MADEADLETLLRLVQGALQRFLVGTHEGEVVTGAKYGEVARSPRAGSAPAAPK